METATKNDRLSRIIMAEGLVKGLELACEGTNSKLSFSYPTMGVTLCVYQNGSVVRAGHAVLSPRDIKEKNGSPIIGCAIAALRAMNKPVPDIFLGT